MNRKLIAITFLVILTILKSYSQIMIPKMQFENNPQNSNIIYYDFYNDTQMIEIDYNNFEKARVDFEDVKNPINSIRPRHYSHNTIIIRNKKGELLHQYNLRGKPYQPSDFIPCDKLPYTISHLGKINNNQEAKSNYPSFGKYNYYVTENNKSGVIDTLGNKILDVIYDTIQPFIFNHKTNDYQIITSQHLNDNETVVFAINKDNKWGFKNNTTLIEPKYDWLIPINKNVLEIKLSNLFGLINYKEEILLKSIYKNLIHKNDFYLYSIENETQDTKQKFGIINSNYKIIKQPIYSNFEDIIENYYPSGNYWTCKTNGCGVINKNGEEISNFDYGTIPVNPYQKFYRTSKYIDSNRSCILDMNFKEIGSNYDAVYNWTPNLFLVRKNSKYGLIDIKENIVLTCEYQNIATDFRNEQTLITKNDNFGVINSNGKIIVPCSFSYISLSNYNTIFVEKNNKNNDTESSSKFGILKNDGTVIIPIKYDAIESIDYGFFKVKNKDLYGVINENGKEITTIKYDEIYNFKNGFCIAKKDFGYGYIDSSGKEITHFYFEKPSDFEYQNNVLLAKAYIAGKEVTIDKNGKTIN